MANPGSRRPRLGPSDLAQLGDVELQERIDRLDREIARLSPICRGPVDRRDHAESVSAERSRGSRHQGERSDASRSDRLSDNSSYVSRWLESIDRSDGGPVRQSGASASALLTGPPPAATGEVKAATGEAKMALVRGEAISKRTLATIKLETYSGSSPLETHLAKLENCADYYGWSERDRLCHLKASLEGHAGQVLWELGPNSTEAEVTKLLRNRFGNVNQMERFRAELHSRRRQPGESTQAVYQDIRRLLALGFPGHSGELLETMGRDAFLVALSDHALRIRVLDQRPKTLDDALAIVCQMEAYSGTAGPAASADDNSDRKRVRWASSSSSVVAPVEPESSAQYTGKRIQQLEADLAEQRRQMRQLRAELNKPEVVPHPPPSPAVQPGWYEWQNPSPVVYPAAAYYQQPSPVPIATQQPQQGAPSGGHQQPASSSSGSRRRGRLDRDTCAKCGQKGHWQRSPDCPLYASSGGNPVNNVNQCGGVSSSIVYSETYLDFIVDGGIKGQALVDSGCDKSLIPRRMVPHAVLSPSDMELYAANGTKISVIGCMRLNFRIQGVSLFADVYVSPDIDELMLGYNWLAENNCHWFFDKGILEINGMPVKLKQRPARAVIGRVYVRELSTVPVDTQVNVPVGLSLSNFIAPKCDCQAEAKEVRPGLLAGRTLLGTSDDFAAIKFINISGKKQELRSGRCWGKAEPGVDIDAPGYLAPAERPKRSRQKAGELGMQQQPQQSGPSGDQPSETASLGQLSSSWDASGLAKRNSSGGGIQDGVLEEETSSDQQVDAQSCTLLAERSSSSEVGVQLARQRDDSAAAEDTQQAGSLSSSSSDQIGVDCESVNSIELPESVSCGGSQEGGCAHLEPVFADLPSELQGADCRRVVELVGRSKDVFSEHEFSMGCADLLRCRIGAGNHGPVAKGLRSHAREVIGQAVGTVLKAGIIDVPSGKCQFSVMIVPGVEELDIFVRKKIFKLPLQPSY